MKHTVEEITLKNGAMGLLIDVPGATVMSFDFELRAGYYLSPREKWETAHIMEHMLLGANEKFPRARRFQAELQKNGASFNASTNTYSINYMVECADFEWERILDLLCLSISKPLFLESEFTSETSNVRDELTGYLNSHFRELSLRMNEAFGMMVITDQERLRLMKHVQLEDIVEHYQRTHRLDNVRFVIAGKMHGRKTKLKKVIESELQLERGERFALPEEKPHALDGVQYTHNSGVGNVHFFLDMFALERLNDDAFDAVSLLNSMLTATLHSLILGEARERGVVYHMGSGVSRGKDSSGWWFGAQVIEENAMALMDIITEQMHKVLHGTIKAHDVEAAKQYSLGRYQRSAQTVGGLANGYRSQYYFDEKIDDYYAVPERIKAVTSKAMVDAARRMFEEKVWGLGVLSNCKKDVAEQLHEKASSLWQ